jgi:hypothetical protein
MDKANATVHRGGSDAAMAGELEQHLRQAFFVLEQQVLGGNDEAEATGFIGLADERDALADAMTIGAGGSTALSSVYLIRTRNDGVAVVAGHDGNIEVGAVTEIMADGATGHFPALFQSVFGWYCLQLGNIHSVARIANIDAGANSMDDDLFYQALETFPSDQQPDFVVMNRRSQSQIQQSRTATNATGAPAPRPTDIEGFPIIVTEGISNAETAVA